MRAARFPFERLCDLFEASVSFATTAATAASALLSRAIGCSLARAAVPFSVGVGVRYQQTKASGPMDKARYTYSLTFLSSGSSRAT